MPGIKHDADKLPYHLISPHVHSAIARSLRHGLTEYPERNWEEGLAYSRCYRAAIGHLLDWWMNRGEHHLDAALTNLHFLAHFREECMTKFDDRPKYIRHPSWDNDIPSPIEWVDRETLNERSSHPIWDMPADEKLPTIHHDGVDFVYPEEEATPPSTWTEVANEISFNTLMSRANKVLHKNEANRLNKLACMDWTCMVESERNEWQHYIDKIAKYEKEHAQV